MSSLHEVLKDDCFPHPTRDAAVATEDKLSVHISAMHAANVDVPHAINIDSDSL